MKQYWKPLDNQVPNGIVNPYSIHITSSSTTNYNMGFNPFETREEKRKRVRDLRRKKLERVFNGKTTHIRKH